MQGAGPCCVAAPVSHIARQMPEAIAGLDSAKVRVQSASPLPLNATSVGCLPGHHRIVDHAGDLAGLHLVAEAERGSKMPPHGA